MSDTPQGEGWWQASDGKWYPPEQHPDARGAEAGRTTESLPPQQAVPSASPDEPHVVYDVNGTLELARWRPLVHWLMAIPLAIMGVFVNVLGFFGWIIAWFAVLFTGKMPVMLHNILTLWLRFHFRLYAFVYGWTIAYPPFTFSPGATDDGEHDTVNIELPELEAETSRVALVNWLLAIPHLIVLYFLFIAFWIVGAIAWFAVLFTGKYPAGMRSFMIGVAHYQMRVMAFVSMLYQSYPRFGI